MRLLVCKMQEERCDELGRERALEFAIEPNPAN